MHIHTPASPVSRVGATSQTALRMADAAATLLGSLSEEQRGQILFPVNDEERKNWHYIPRSRKGLPFREMDGSQQKLAHRLIACGLSRGGYSKAMAIMSLEKTLKDLEGAARVHERDSDLYFITLFGNPSDLSPWGWRVEGHHVSFNFLVVDNGGIASAPHFFGANPARVPDGRPLAGFKILAAEEDLARQLLTSFDPAQQSRTVVSSDAPGDILTRAEVAVKTDAPIGLALSEMAPSQEEILNRLLAEYVNRMPTEMAEARMEEIEKEGKGYIHFAWAGSGDPGRPHYYRLHGPGFLVEYDNTQDHANHIHSVWRDLRNDWGEDLLTRHYRNSHR
jgi:hypothetical protein